MCGHSILLPSSPLNGALECSLLNMVPALQYIKKMVFPSIVLPPLCYIFLDVIRYLLLPIKCTSNTASE